MRGSNLRTFSTLVSCFILWQFFCRNLVDGARILSNVFCSPQPAVVATDEHKYPYFVALSRCQGSGPITLEPTRRRCVATKEEVIKFKVKNTTSEKFELFSLKNHTACKSECSWQPSDCEKPKILQNCQCKCPLKLLQFGMDCGPGSSFSRVACKCLCDNKVENCGRKRYFDKKTCSCQCKPKRIAKCREKGGHLNYKNCKCSDNHLASAGGHKNEKTRNILWMIVVATEFVVLVLTFQIFLYFKEAGLIYIISKRWHRRAALANINETNKPVGKELVGIGSRIVDEADQNVYFVHSRYQTLNGTPL